MAAEFSDNLLTLFLLNVLSVPALLHHVSIMSQEVSALCSHFKVFCSRVDN